MLSTKIQNLTESQIVCDFSTLLLNYTQISHDMKAPSVCRWKANEFYWLQRLRNKQEKQKTKAFSGVHKVRERERERKRGRVKENLLIKKQTNGRKEKRPFIQNTYIEYPNYMLGYTSLALQNS